jgi:hypothetical protein
VSWRGRTSVIADNKGQVGCRGEQGGDGHVVGACFSGIEALDCSSIKGVRADAVNGVGGKGNQAAGDEHPDGLGYRFFEIGRENTCVQSHSTGTSDPTLELDRW